MSQVENTAQQKTQREWLDTLRSAPLNDRPLFAADGVGVTATHNGRERGVSENPQI